MVDSADCGDYLFYLFDPVRVFAATAGDYFFDSDLVYRYFSDFLFFGGQFRNRRLCLTGFVEWFGGQCRYLCDKRIQWFRKRGAGTLESNRFGPALYKSL